MPERLADLWDYAQQAHCDYSGVGCSKSERRLLNNLCRLHQEWLRDRKPQSPRGLQIDDHVKRRWTLNWQVARVRAFEDLVHIRGRTAIEPLDVLTVDEESARLDIGCR